jgi:hypothetical protein
MEADVLVGEKRADRVERVPLRQVGMQRGRPIHILDRSIHIREVVEFNKDVFVVWVGARKRHPLIAHGVGISDVSLGIWGFPNIQQPISIRVLNGRAQDHGPPGDTPAVGLRWHDRSRLGSIVSCYVTQDPGRIVPHPIDAWKWR